MAGHGPPAHAGMHTKSRDIMSFAKDKGTKHLRDSKLKLESFAAPSGAVPLPQIEIAPAETLWE